MDNPKSGCAIFITYALVIIILVLLSAGITQWAWNVLAPVFNGPELTYIQSIALVSLLSALKFSYKSK